MDLHINIQNVTVTEIAASSGIFSGENYHAHWSAMAKANTGLNLGGESSLSKECLNMVYDSDYVGMHQMPAEFLRTWQSR